MPGGAPLNKDAEGHLTALHSPPSLCSFYSGPPVLYGRPVRASTPSTGHPIVYCSFPHKKRGDELSRTLIQRVLCLPNECSLLFNSQWAKALCSGADHLLTVSYDQQCSATYTVRAVEQVVTTGTTTGWGMDKDTCFRLFHPESYTMLRSDA